MADRLGRLALRENPRARRTGLPSLWLFTDPHRLPDPLAAAAALPRGAGVVLRAFGRPEVEAIAPALAALARRRDLVLLIGENAALAAAVGARGVHLPQRRWADLPKLRAAHPGWRFTVAAHDGAALRRARAVRADAAFLSPVFPSASPSATRPLGRARMARLVAAAELPVYALGGITAAAAGGLVGSGVAGIAAVDGLRT